MKLYQVKFDYSSGTFIARELEVVETSKLFKTRIGGINKQIPKDELGRLITDQRHSIRLLCLPEELGAAIFQVSKTGQSMLEEQFRRIEAAHRCLQEQPVFHRIRPPAEPIEVTDDML